MYFTGSIPDLSTVELVAFTLPYNEATQANCTAYGHRPGSACVLMGAWVDFGGTPWGAELEP